MSLFWFVHGFWYLKGYYLVIRIVLLFCRKLVSIRCCQEYLLDLGQQLCELLSALVAVAAELAELQAEGAVFITDQNGLYLHQLLIAQTSPRSVGIERQSASIHINQRLNPQISQNCGQLLQGLLRDALLQSCWRLTSSLLIDIIGHIFRRHLKIIWLSFDDS